MDIHRAATWSSHNYFDTLDPTRLQRHVVKRLESLGYEVTLAERKAA
jgi:hypothetical protein